MATPSTTLTTSSSPIPNGHYEPPEEEEVFMTEENRPSFTACYEWKLPAFTYNYIDKLTEGYIRLKSKKYSLYVPRDITATCMTYYYDLNVTNSIKTASNGQGFKSNLFSIGPFKFYMDICYVIFSCFIPYTMYFLFSYSL